MPRQIRTKRVYDPPAPEDGTRVLVDRLWPRGLKKAEAAIDLWLKDAAPSAELRRWFGHDPACWDEFRRRYAAELDANRAAVQPLVELSGTATLLFAAHDSERNNAVALAAWLRAQGIIPKENAMESRSRGDYKIAHRELVAEGADLRVQVLTLDRGQSIPWHYHSEITDSFVCLEGPMVVETRAPRNAYRLAAGERCAVPPKTAHYVHGEQGGPCKFLIIQGVGIYDFVPVGG